MGNKNTSLAKGPEDGAVQQEEGVYVHSSTVQEQAGNLTTQLIEKVKNNHPFNVQEQAGNLTTQLIEKVKNNHPFNVQEQAGNLTTQLIEKVKNNHPFNVQEQAGNLTTQLIEKVKNNHPFNGSISTDEAQNPSQELLASLQSLGENSDYTLLPHSLHQIAEAYWMKEDYQWAVQFLQLEKLYHERLLTNLTALQEHWESQWRDKKDSEDSLPVDTDGMSQKHVEILNHICRTHHRPSVSMDKNELNAALKNSQSESLQPPHGEATTPDETCCLEEKAQSMSSESKLSSQQSDAEEEEDGGEETYEEGQEVEEEGEEEERCEETPEEEDVKVEWPTGVPQASDKDLAKLSHKDGNSSPDGLVSILKRRRASLDGLPPPSNTAVQQTSKRRVRFSEPEDGMEQDDVGGDSCLILLLLCLVTVVISIGGTAFYCTLVDTYSNICTDFTHNVDFYATSVRRFFEGVRHWLPFWT